MTFCQSLFVGCVYEHSTLNRDAGAQETRSCHCTSIRAWPSWLAHLYFKRALPNEINIVFQKIIGNFTELSGSKF